MRGSKGNERSLKNRFGHSEGDRGIQERDRGDVSLGPQVVLGTLYIVKYIIEFL